MEHSVFATTDVLRLQALSQLRWELLLGLPRLVEIVEWELRPSARRDRALGFALSAWAQSCAQPFPLDEHVRRSRTLAEAARRVDPLGHLAMALHRAIARRLETESGPVSSAHRANLDAACRRYVETRNRLILRGREVVDDVLDQLSVDEHRRGDAFQNGVFGLMRSFEMFDGTRHRSFDRLVRRQIEAAQTEFASVAA